MESARKLGWVAPSDCAPGAGCTTGGLLSALAAAGRPAVTGMAIAERIDGCDVKVGDIGGMVGTRRGDENLRLHQGDAVRVADGEGFSGGRENPKRLEGVAVQQIPDGIGGGAHIRIVARIGAAMQRDAPACKGSHGATLAVDDLDRAEVSALTMGETIGVTAADLSAGRVRMELAELTMCLSSEL